MEEEKIDNQGGWGEPSRRAGLPEFATFNVDFDYLSNFANISFWELDRPVEVRY